MSNIVEYLKGKDFFTFDLSSQDIKDGFLIDKYKGDIYEAGKFSIEVLKLLTQIESYQNTDKRVSRHCFNIMP